MSWGAATSDGLTCQNCEGLAGWQDLQTYGARNPGTRESRRDAEPLIKISTHPCQEQLTSKECWDPSSQTSSWDENF